MPSTKISVMPVTNSGVAVIARPAMEMMRSDNRPSLTPGHDAQEQGQRHDEDKGDPRQGERIAHPGQQRHRHGPARPQRLSGIPPEQALWSAGYTRPGPLPSVRIPALVRT